MFSNATVALLVAIGFGGWVYAKTQKHTGNNTQTSLIVAVLCAGLAFLTVFTIMGFIPSN